MITITQMFFVPTMCMCACVERSCIVCTTVQFNSAILFYSKTKGVNLKTKSETLNMDKLQVLK